MLRLVFTYFFVMSDPCFSVSLEDVAKHALSEKSVSSIQWEGKKIWIKGVDPDRNTFQYCFLRKVLYRMIPVDFLNHAPLCGEEVINLEIARLKEFKESNIPVPSILGSGKGWVAVTDEGKSLHKYTKREPRHRQQELVRAALDTLIRLHQKNLAHGRALMRDMVYNPQNHAISFIDLSEYSPQLMPLEKAQTRDFLVFIFSISNYKGVDDIFLESIFNQYWNAASPSVKKELVKLNRSVSTYSFMIDPYCTYIGKRMDKASLTGSRKSALISHSHRICKITKQFPRWVEARSRP